MKHKLYVVTYANSLSTQLSALLQLFAFKVAPDESVHEQLVLLRLLVILQSLDLPLDKLLLMVSRAPTEDVPHASQLHEHLSRVR